MQAQHALAAEGLAPLVQLASPQMLNLVLLEQDLERAIHSLHRQIIAPALCQEAGSTLPALAGQDEPASEQCVAASH
jgi:hypothetical protein